MIMTMDLPRRATTATTQPEDSPKTPQDGPQTPQDTPEKLRDCPKGGPARSTSSREQPGAQKYKLLYRFKKKFP